MGKNAPRSGPRLAYFLTQEAVYLLVHFKFLRVYTYIQKLHTKTFYHYISMFDQISASKRHDYCTVSQKGDRFPQRVQLWGHSQKKEQTSRLATTHRAPFRCWFISYNTSKNVLRTTLSVHIYIAHTLIKFWWSHKVILGKLVPLEIFSSQPCFWSHDFDFPSLTS